MISKADSLRARLALGLLGCSTACAVPAGTAPAQAAAPHPLPPAAATQTAREVAVPAPVEPEPLRLPAADGPIWERDGVLALRVAGTQLESISAPGCELERGSPATGAVTWRRALEPALGGDAARCSCTLGADAVGCLVGDHEVRIIASASGQAVGKLERAHEDFVWNLAATRVGLLAYESPWRHITKLPSPRLVVFDSRTNRTRSTNLEPVARRWLRAGSGPVLEGLLPFSGPTRLVARDPATLAERWRVDPPPGEHWVVAAADERSIVTHGGAFLTLLDTMTGRTRWRIEVGRSEEDPDVALGSTVALARVRRGDRDLLLAVAVADGHELWRLERAAGESSLAATAGRVFWLHRSTLLVLDQRTGGELWRWYLPDERSVWAPHPELVVLSIPHGAVTAFAAANTLASHRRELTGRIRVTSTLRGVRSDFADIELSVAETPLELDRRGRFRATLVGRGRASVHLDAREWLAPQRIKTPPGTFACTRETPVSVDFETAADAPELEVLLEVKACPIR